MGGVTSKLLRSRQQQVNSTVERLMKADALKEQETLKILLLGTGSSGKSTILKQFKILHTKQGLGEPHTYRNLVSYNIMLGILRACEHASTLEDVSSKLTPETQKLGKFLRDNRDKDIWYEVTLEGRVLSIGEVCRRLWHDEALRQAADDPYSSIEIALEYYMEKIEEIARPAYIPTEQDILHLRQRTTGVVSLPIVFRGASIRVVDVGGQRNERKKWISHFDNVTAILFVVSLNDFDKPLLEDLSVNRMQEAVSVFTDIATCPYFERTNIILLLNKKDLFLSRMREQNGDLRICFPEYTGPPGDYRAAVNFIRKKFENIFKDSKKGVEAPPLMEIHNTVGTDTKNVQNVFRSCRRILLNETLASIGS